MQRLSDSAAAEWCTGRGIQVGGSPAERSLDIAESHPYTFRVRMPVAAPRRLALAHELLMIGAGHEDTAFVGGMFWLTDWDIWTETVERAGRLLRCRLLGEHQAQTDAVDSQAELYSTDEGIEIQGAVTLALIFEWDAYVIPAVGDVLAFISHDGYVEFAATTDSALASTIQRLGPYQ